MLVGRLFAILFLLLCLSLVAQCALPGQVVEATRAASEISPVQDAPQTEGTTTNARIGLILGNLLILSLYAFPMSIGEEWALADPKKEPSDSLEAVETTGNEAPAAVDEWTALLERLREIRAEME